MAGPVVPRLLPGSVLWVAPTEPQGRATQRALERTAQKDSERATQQFRLCRELDDLPPERA